MNVRTLLRRPAFLISLALLVGVVLLWLVPAALAARPKTLDDRTYEVASQLQCPVCNGESVAASNSAIATQMRGVIHTQLASGRSEQQVLAYFQSVYGDSILESPPKQGFTTLIWVVPFVALLAGVGIIYSVGREWRDTRGTRGAATGEVLAPAGQESSGETPAGALTPDETERFRALLRQQLEAEEGLPLRHGSERGS